MKPMRIGLCQVRAFDLPDAEAALAACLAAIDHAAAEGARLIVLPECAYPAYVLESREAYDRVARPREELLALFGERARQHGAHIVAGLAIPNARDVLVNAALLFEPQGSVQAQYEKSFLWHFDARWFGGGGRYPVADIDGARVGMLVCADARLPEIARSLAVGGADLIIDSTAWVSNGRTTDALVTPQVAYLMATRAVENGVWVIAADKVGMEADSIMYAGQSGVIDPQGKWVAQASSDREEVLVVDVPLTPARLPVVRHPALYADLTDEGGGNVSATLREALVPEDRVGRVAVLQASGGLSLEAFMVLIGQHLEVQAGQDAQVLVVPDLLADPVIGTEVVDALAKLTAIPGSPALYCTVREQTDAGTQCVGYFLRSGGVEARHVATHSGTWENGGAVGDTVSPIFPTALGNTALLAGVEGLVPELVRGLMLRGADTVLWSAGRLPVALRPLARARADENRIYFALATPRPAAVELDLDRDGALIVAPGGAVIAEGLLTHDLSFAADVQVATARVKRIAPETNVLTGRRPATYGALIQDR